MPRTLWSGSLSFGLVNVPVELHPATQDLDLHFHELHEKDGTRLVRRRYCSCEDVEVPWEEIGHGYELDDGQMITITDDELASVRPKKTRTIDIEAFVERAQVDPIYYDRPYALVPAGEEDGTLRAYTLLVEVMSRTDRAALGRIVMHNKEHLATIQVRDGVLALTTMRFHDEVRSSADVPTGGAEPTRNAVADAVSIIDELTTEWDPTAYTDGYRERLAKVVTRKRKGQPIQAPEPAPEPSPAPDLMAALQRTLEKTRELSDGPARKRKRPASTTAPARRKAKAKAG